MAISSIKIEDGCTACALCEQICPEVFEMGADVVQVKAGVDFGPYIDQINEAVDSCPVSVIKVS